MYYFLFNKEGKFVGYTTFKKMAKGIVDQRKLFYPLKIQKVSDDYVNKEIRNQLIGYDIFNYHGVYLFEHEEDDIVTTVYETITRNIEKLRDLQSFYPFLKFSDEEEKIMAEFYKIINGILYVVDNDYYEYEEPLERCFKIKDMVMKILRDMYKEGV
jgi:hypothetical protein